LAAKNNWNASDFTILFRGLLVELKTFVDDPVLDIRGLIFQPADHSAEEAFVPDLLIGQSNSTALLVDPEAKPPTIDSRLHRKRDRCRCVRCSQSCLLSRNIIGQATACDKLDQKKKKGVET
jgi:hypothetical protein